MSERIRGLKVEHLGISTLKPYARNARTHTNKQIRQIAASIETFGWTNPILIDQDRQIVAGHGRLAAAKLLGLEEIPAIRLSDLTEAQVRAYVIADNRLAELAGWDEELLSIELKALCEIELDFDIEVIGFNTAEIDGLVLGPTEPDDDADRVPEIDADAPPITVPGDLWQLGKHRLLCGDARDPRSFETLLDGEAAQMVFTDPPYNVPIDGNVCGLGRVRHKEFAMASGEMSEAEFSNFLEVALRHLCTHSRDGAIHYICMDWRHIRELLTVGRGVYSELKNICVWNKSNGGMGALYRSKHEFIPVFKAGTGPHIKQCRPRRLWAQPHERLGLCRDQRIRQRPGRPTGHAPDGQTGRHGRGCRSRLLAPQRDRARPLCGIGYYHHRRRTRGAPRLRHRDRPRIHRHRAAAIPHIHRERARAPE